MKTIPAENGGGIRLRSKKPRKQRGFLPIGNRSIRLRRDQRHSTLVIS
jgi:hypothetical protein